MNPILTGINISPVNMEDRKNLGVKAGDTVRVHQKIQDKEKTRLQVFEGLVLGRKHGNEPGATFTVRKVVDGIGVEKIFPLYSPLIDKIEIVKRSKVRRAKLYYIREKVAREIRRQMRRMRLMSLSSESETEMAAEREQNAKDEAARVAVAEAEAKALADAQAAAEATAKAEADAKAAEEAKATEVVAEVAPEAEPTTEAAPEVAPAEETK